MNQIPSITVVTVVYNAVDEIEETITSVLKQTYSNLEYIVVDGASKDGTVELIQKYSDSISHWISEPDKGIYDAMNKAIDMATGDWILFMNAGDYFYSENAVSDMFTPQSDYTAYDVVYGDAEFRLKTFSYVIEALESAPDRFMPFSHQAAFTRTALAKKNKFNLIYKIAADTEFFLRLTRGGSVFKHISVIVCSYDARKGMSVHNEVRRSKELVDMQIKYGANPSAYYRKFVRDARIKQFIRQILPNFIWERMREDKLRKHYGEHKR